jgi:hypothetical protein
MLHMMLRLEESRNKEQRKVQSRWNRQPTGLQIKQVGNPAAFVNAAGNWRWSVRLSCQGEGASLLDHGM